LCDIGNFSGLSRWRSKVVCEEESSSNLKAITAIVAIDNDAEVTTIAAKWWRLVSALISRSKHAYGNAQQ